MFSYGIRKTFRIIHINILGHERKKIVREIWCMQRCKSLRDLKFYKVFSRYCEHPRVL